MSLPVDSKFCISLEVDRQNNAHWHLAIGYEYREEVKRIFKCHWNAAIKRWKIPFAPPWQDQPTVREAVIAIINRVDNRSVHPEVTQTGKPVQSPHFRTMGKHPSPPSFQSNREKGALSFLHSNTTNNIPPRVPPVNQNDDASSSSSSSRPAYSQQFNPDDHFPYNDDNDEEGDLIVMSPPKRKIPSECENYAKYKAKEIQALIAAKVTLYVDEEPFSGGVTCVAITGTIEEVLTYYENRFSNAPDMIDYVDYMEKESKAHNRAARIVIQFIL